MCHCQGLLGMVGLFYPCLDLWPEYEQWSFHTVMAEGDISRH